MLNCKINIDQDYIRNLANNHQTDLLKKLSDKPDKTFSITLDSEVYELRYEIQDNTVKVYIKTPEEWLGITMPVLRMDLRHHGLPDAMKLPGNDTEECSNDLDHEGFYSPDDIQKVISYIQNIGFLDIIFGNV